LFQCMNDLNEAGVNDDIFALIFEANRENLVAEIEKKSRKL
jgi:hypothetical protein